MKHLCQSRETTNVLVMTGLFPRTAHRSGNRGVVPLGIRLIDKRHMTQWNPVDVGFADVCGNSATLSARANGSLGRVPLDDAYSALPSVRKPGSGNVWIIGAARRRGHRSQRRDFERGTQYNREHSSSCNRRGFLAYMDARSR